MIASYPVYINGEFCDKPQKKEVINPCNGETIARASVADRNDIETAIKAARFAFDEGEWPRLSLAKRKEFLLKIAQGILDKAKDLAELETLNTGKPIKETTFMDIPSAAKAFEYVAHNLERYLPTQELKLENAQSSLVYEPYGTAVLIVPWNYPLLITAWKLASALGVGNTVILKPSSLTPLTVLELAKIINAAGLPKGVVNILNAEGQSAGEILCADKRVDMVSFTGSNRVGKQIIQYTAKNVKKMILELGGKSAGIVLEDADLELAVNGSLCSIFLNQGQMCTAMSRIFVQDKVYTQFVEDFVQKVKKIKLGSGLDYETQMGPLISEGQRQRVISYVEEAKAEGAKLLYGGNVPDEPEFKKGFFFTPTVFTDVNEKMPIFQEEVFGPVACISRFSNIDEAVGLTNNSDFALASSIWTKDLDKAKTLAGKINAGVVWINTYGMFYNEVPYGGFKQSGFGKELGREGLLEYCRLKNIFTDDTQGAKPLVNYWYG